MIVFHGEKNQSIEGVPLQNADISPADSEGTLETISHTESLRDIPHGKLIESLERSLEAGFKDAGMEFTAPLRAFLEEGIQRMAGGENLDMLSLIEKEKDTAAQLAAEIPALEASLDLLEKQCTDSSAAEEDSSHEEGGDLSVWEQKLGQLTSVVDIQRHTRGMLLKTVELNMAAVDIERAVTHSS